MVLQTRSFAFGCLGPHTHRLTQGSTEPRFVQSSRQIALFSFFSLILTLHFSTSYSRIFISISCSSTSSYSSFDFTMMARCICVVSERSQLPFCYRMKCPFTFVVHSLLILNVHHHNMWMLMCSIRVDQVFLFRRLCSGGTASMYKMFGLHTIAFIQTNKKDLQHWWCWT